jgi:hypothetical protein
VERGEIEKCDIRHDRARDTKPEKIKHLFVGRATPGVISRNTGRSLLAELPALNVVFIRGIDTGHYGSPYLSALLEQTAFGHLLFRSRRMRPDVSASLDDRRVAGCLHRQTTPAFVKLKATPSGHRSPCREHMDGIEQSASLLVIRQTRNCNAEDIQMLTTLEDVALLW